MLSRVLLLFICLFWKPNVAIAQTMFSPTYQLRYGNFNMTSGVKTSTTYSLTDSVGQTAASNFTSTGYTIGAGAQYLYQIYDFSFAVSQTTLDFGSLNPSAFNNTSLDLVVSTPRQGYTVTTLASTRLKNNTNYIANTTCNSSCTTTSAGIWTNNSSYGFGYNLTGHDIATDFTDATYFRPFPDLSASQAPAPIMTTVQAGKSRTATVNLQLALDPDQPFGTYSNLIYFIATPNY